MGESESKQKYEHEVRSNTQTNEKGGLKTCRNQTKEKIWKILKLENFILMNIIFEPMSQNSKKIKMYCKHSLMILSIVSNMNLIST